MPRENRPPANADDQPNGARATNGSLPPEFPEEARRALEQYAAYEAALVGPTPQWDLPDLNPNLPPSD